MGTCYRFLAATPVLLAAAMANAAVKTTIDRNDSEHAIAQFKFEHVPSPARSSAATKARISIVDGEQDPNGGDPDKLSDGLLPAEADQPAENFFFNSATQVGRLKFDLGRVINIERIDTYSWHPNTRGPQVYKVFASDGTSAGFNAEPRNGTEPAGCGWKLIASIDTRPNAGPAGGQYGVSIADSAGSLGQYRYLLFEMFPTEDTDRFGNTFYSEIDVIDHNAHVASSGPTSQPADSTYQIIIDTSETPDLKDWAETKLRPVLERWYPKIVADFPSDGFTAPGRFKITFLKDMKGVANTSGTQVRCAADWFRRNLKGEAIGAIVHEMVHVVQQYHSGKNPGWLVEGIADYIRWFKFEPQSRRPHVNPERAKYTDSYRTTAAFLNYVTEHHGEAVVMKLNAEMREGKYSPDLWQKFTGKSVEELWEGFVSTLK